MWLHDAIEIRLLLFGEIAAIQGDARRHGETAVGLCWYSLLRLSGDEGEFPDNTAGTDDVVAGRSRDTQQTGVHDD